MPKTADQARYENETARLLAVVDVLDRMRGQNHQHVAEAVLGALKTVEPVLPDDCDHVDDKGESDCVREYGHPPFVVQTDYNKRDRLPDDSAPTGYRIEYGTKEDHSAGGHYTYEYDDDRRPDGSHPWDF